MCTDFLNMPTNRVVRFMHNFIFVYGMTNGLGRKRHSNSLLIYALSFLTNNLSIHQLKTIIYEK